MPKPPLRALQTLIPDREPGRELETARLLPRASIRPNPWQPRRHADPERLAELAADIGARGILQPIVVRPVGANQFEVIAGERRYQAAGVAGLAELPVIIRDDVDESEARAIALVENLQREDLDIEDEARFLGELKAQGLSLREIGAAIHKSYQYVNRRIKLLETPGALLAYRAGQLNLNELITDPASGVADVPMQDLAAAASAAAAELQQVATAVTPGNNTDPAPSVTRGNNSSSAVPGSPGDTGPWDANRARMALSLKPFHVFKLQLHRVEPEAVPPAETLELRRTIGDIIDELTALDRRLAGKEVDA